MLDNDHLIDKFMNYCFSSIFLLIVMMSCVAQEKDNALIDSNFTDIVKEYIKENDEIPNDCDATPFYKIYFNNCSDSLCFWIGAHIGIPSPVLPNEPGTMSFSNPIEIKGYAYVNKRLVIFYDYALSDGNGLYSPRKLINYSEEAFEKLPEGCENVLYPVALCYNVSRDSIYLKDKREAFQLK